MWKWITVTLGALALACVCVPMAKAEGLNLSWEDCGAAGYCNTTFACNSNSAAFALVGSFVPPEGTTAITGEEIIIDLQSESAAVPDWWKFKNAGSCRQTALSGSSDFVSLGLMTCADYWQAAATGGVTAYMTPYGGMPNRARILTIFTNPPGAADPLDGVSEYYAFRLNFTASNTVGTGACAGCSVPVLIVLNELKLTQPIGVGNYRMSNVETRNYVDWQAAASPCTRVPVRNQTWGAIKTLYR